MAQAAGGVAVGGDPPQAGLVPGDTGLVSRVTAVHRFVSQPDEELIGLHIAAAIEQEAVGAVPIPARPACLLVIALQVLGHIIVQHIPDVRLVDAHAEGVGGHHHRHRPLEEGVLSGGALLRGQAGVIAGGGDVPLRQEGVDLLHRFPGRAVDDAALVLMLLDELEEGCPLTGGLPDLEEEIFPVEAGHL